jgi:hypothetical protein
MKNNTLVPQVVHDVGGGAGLTAYFECGGTGKWPRHPDGKMRQCVDCKGTAKVYISI